MPKIGEKHKNAMMFEAAQKIAFLKSGFWEFINGAGSLRMLIKEANELLKTLKSIQESEKYYATDSKGIKGKTSEI